MRPRLRRLARAVLPPLRRRVENLAWRLEALEDDAREPFQRRAVADTDPLPKWFAAAVRPPFGTAGPVPQTIGDIIDTSPLKVSLEDHGPWTAIVETPDYTDPLWEQSRPRGG